MQEFEQFLERLIEARDQHGRHQWAMGSMILDAFGPDGDSAFGGKTIADVGDEASIDPTSLYSWRKVARYLGDWYAKHEIKPPFRHCQRAVRHCAERAPQIMEQWVARGRPSYIEFCEWLSTVPRDASNGHDPQQRRIERKKAKRFVRLVERIDEHERFDRKCLTLAESETVYSRIRHLSRSWRNTMRSKRDVANRRKGGAAEQTGQPNAIVSGLVRQIRV